MNRLQGFPQLWLLKSTTRISNTILYFECFPILFRKDFLEVIFLHLRTWIFYIVAHDSFISNARQFGFYFRRCYTKHPRRYLEWRPFKRTNACQIIYRYFYVLYNKSKTYRILYIILYLAASYITRTRFVWREYTQEAVLFLTHQCYLTFFSVEGAGSSKV